MKIPRSRSSRSAPGQASDAWQYGKRAEMTDLTSKNYWDRYSHKPNPLRVQSMLIDIIASIYVIFPCLGIIPIESIYQT